MQTQIFASIITIGDELLIGQVVDTNSAFIAQELNKIGIAVKHRMAVGDNYDDIWNALDNEKKHSKIIIITGGLGPTADDITKPLLCKYFNGKMITDTATLEHVEHIFTNILKRPIIERNRKQAEVPDVCTVLKNEMGTAPGMMFTEKDVLFFSLPGVPFEMKWLMENHVLKIIKEKHNTTFIEHRTLLTAGVGESFLAEKLIDFEAKLPAHFKLAYLPKFGMVRLRLTANSNNKEALVNEIENQFSLLNEIVKDSCVSNEDLSLEEIVAKKLLEKNKTLATAESCTGGTIASLITSLSGSSKYFKGSVVAYSNEVKENILDVQQTALIENGAVSEMVVTQMAENILNKFKVDYSIAVSGIMGPNGGTKEKPVGTVWIAIASKNKTITKSFHFRFDRKRNTDLAVMNAMLLLLSLINEDD